MTSADRPPLTPGQPLWPTQPDADRAASQPSRQQPPGTRVNGAPASLPIAPVVRPPNSRSRPARRTLMLLVVAVTAAVVILLGGLLFFF